MALLQLQRDKQVTVSLHDGEKVTSPSTLADISELPIGTKPVKRCVSVPDREVLSARAGSCFSGHRCGRRRLPAAVQREAAGRAGGETGPRGRQVHQLKYQLKVE